MARGPMSDAHKAAISRGMRQYWATKKSSSGNSSIQTDKGGTITREEAARIMFGTRVATQKIAKKKRKRR